MRGEVCGVKVYDDFAHHPTAIAATVNALKQRVPRGERVIAVFEPRSNTMKLGAMRARLAESLIDADRVDSADFDGNRHGMGLMSRRVPEIKQPRNPHLNRFQA